MEEYENQVAKYLRKVGNYARYCVTHDFLGNELIPRRIQMRLVLTMFFIAIMLSKQLFMI